MRETDADADSGARELTSGTGSTTRQRIADSLRADARSASGLATEFGITADSARSHVRHIARSLDDADERLLVKPPACRDCGFEAFDDPANYPSRCPECKSEAIDEPVFTID